MSERDPIWTAFNGKSPVLDIVLPDSLRSSQALMNRAVVASFEDYLGRRCVWCGQTKDERCHNRDLIEEYVSPSGLSIRNRIRGKACPDCIERLGLV